jgi:Domain of unknown function (DUF4410)
MMKYAFQFTAILAGLLTLAGCASTGVVRNASPVSTSLPVSLDLVLVETTSSLKSPGTARRLLDEAIISGLRETHLFGMVGGNPADLNSGHGIKVRADIQEIKMVSRSARAWFGALAGKAQILVQVTVSDLKSGLPIEVFEAEGNSGQSARAGTTDQAVQRAADVIVAEMVKISRLTSP